MGIARRGVGALQNVGPDTGFSYMARSRVKIPKRKKINIKARRVVKRNRANKMQSKTEARWKEHQRYIENRKTEQWIVDAKNSLDWFLEIMGKSEWDRRKKSVVAYFKKQ